MKSRSPERSEGAQKTSVPDKATIKQYMSYRQAEIDSAALYRTLADAEAQRRVGDIYRQLADAEEEHARFWEQKLREAGIEPPPARPGWRSRMLGWLGKRFGAQSVLPTIVSMEKSDSARYDGDEAARGTSLSADETAHAQLLSTLSKSSKANGGGGVEGATLAGLEGRHRAMGGNALRASVLGANDGLVSNLSLVMGVAGAELSNTAILITGLAGLLAGAISMSLGEWLSVQSSRELYKRQIEIERREIAESPADEELELALIYQSKGLPELQAKELAAQLMANGDSALDTIVREELGIDPKELGGSAWEAAGMSFMLFVIGAIVPVSPFIFLSGMTAVAVSLVVSAIALFIIGGAITLMTGRSIIFSGTRQVVFGLVAAAITFGIGRLIGVSIAG